MCGVKKNDFVYIVRFATVCMRFVYTQICAERRQKRFSYSIVRFAAVFVKNGTSFSVRIFATRCVNDKMDNLHRCVRVIAALDPQTLTMREKRKVG